jgi:ABC-2 type transport system ATP-binding protein
MSSTDVIVSRGLRKSYRGTTVLDGVDFAVGRGRIFALLGPNGAGKTTTVNILTTLVKPDSGTATIEGFDVVREPARVRAAISLTGQFAAVDPFQSGAENLKMMAKLAHLDRAASRRRVDELVERFDLGEASTRKAETYSGGMRRRLDLAISLLAAPPVVFLDEPTTGLDPRSRSQVWQAVKQLAEAGTTILLTTQYLEEADQLADSIAVLDAGRIVATGTATELKSGLDSDRVQLSFADSDSFERAALAGFGAEAVFDVESSSVTVRATDPVDTTRRLLAIADSRDLRVGNIAILKPTLDDVFLHFTGSSTDATTPARNEEEAA